MKDRRWTILIVPHGSEAPRQFDVGERLVRALTGVAGVVVLLGLAAGVLLFSPWATPGARLAARENIKLEREVAEMDAALAQLADSVALLAEREAQFRQLAGITTIEDARQATRAEESSAGPATNTVGRASLDAGRPRPFAAVFGNRATRPDVDALLRRASELSSGFAAVTDSMSVKIEKLRNTPSIMPTVGWLTGEFSKSRMHPILHERRPHDGIDVSAPAGTPIVAPAGGVVKKVAVEGGFGNVVEIDHGNGIVTRYAHCSRIVVRRGQRVDRGQTIATVGSSGLAVGPHLHYEIIVDGRPVNPLTYVLPNSAP